MKTRMTRAVASFAMLTAAYGQNPVANFDLSCITSLELPTRGLLAARAGTSGTVRALAQIGSEGQLAKLDLLGDNSLLNGEVRVAMNLSNFAVRCKGRTLEFVFAFTLQEPPLDSITPPGVRFVPPNRFELVFRPVKANIEPPAPKKPLSPPAVR
jgi:hypothetical protein